MRRTVILYRGEPWWTFALLKTQSSHRDVDKYPLGCKMFPQVFRFSKVSSFLKSFSLLKFKMRTV